MANKLGFSIFPHGNNWTYKGTRAVWQEAEQLGFEVAWTQDNIMSHSPYSPVDLEKWEAFTLLAAISDATYRIRIGTMATPAIRRIPPLIAKMVASIDNISGGRMILGIGAGDDEVQYRAWGQAFPPPAERVAILRESIEIQKLMWTQDRTSFDGEHFRIENVALSPKPIQKPHPPIWVAIGQGTKLMPQVAADHANGICVEWGDDTVAEKIIKALERNCEGRDRDINEITRGRLVWIVFTDGSLDHDATVDGIYDVVGWRPLKTYFDVIDPIVYGTPEQVVRGLESRVLNLGFNHVIAVPIAVGIEVDPGQLEGSEGNFNGAMRHLAEVIVPEFS